MTSALVPSPAAAGYNFGSQDSPDYFLLARALRKPFLIGDGTNPLNPAQKVLVPTGATRFFLGSFDPSDQENNVGSFFVKVYGGGGGTTSGAKLTRPRLAQRQRGLGGDETQRAEKVR